ncbi:pilus assembly PilX family protein [Vreelandella nanhaiensis]|uniref:Type 4 fimbrial biogenesis protein PilX N-terminal domain-containing protein n=1 Tax=Vreelandella nanhaiensis TaxID=1258546 RepID=A0A433KTV6_9GAMM|nr:hypothetical protein [Halomonas nanhaiensis]RUR33007.1 hypothetical protein ELY38_05505 [Halomonas nanhaiensis]
MKHQQGAALVIVMGLLSAALLVGVASMQSALVDERLAGNFRAYVQTQMVEESLLVAVAGNRHSAQRDILFTRLAESLGSGDHYRLQEKQLHELLGESTLKTLLNHLPFNQETAHGNQGANSLAVDVKKLNGRRMAVTVNRHGQADTQADIQPQAQLVFVQTDTESHWQLARFH